MVALFNEVSALVTDLQKEGSPHLLVTGSQGSGKSTLMAGLRDAMEAAHLPVLFYSFEEGLEKSCVDHMVDAITQQGKAILTERCLAYRCLPIQDLSGESSLPRFEIQEGILYVLIDGLDYAKGPHHLDASLFSVDLPACMRLVVAAGPGPHADALMARGFHAHAVGPLSRKDKRMLVDRVLNGLPDGPAVVEALLDWSPGGHPSHLLCASELTRRTGSPPAATDEALTVVSRLLDLFPLTREEMAMLAVSRCGVPFLTQPTDGFLRDRVLSPLVVERADLALPATLEVRQVLFQRCSEATLRFGRMALVDRLASLCVGAVLQEAVEHLIDLGDMERLAEFLSTFEVFQVLCFRSAGNLSQYWQNVGSARMIKHLWRMFEEQRTKIEPVTLSALLNNISLILSKCGFEDEAVQFCRRSLDSPRRLSIPAQNNKVVGLLNLAEMLAKKPQSYGEAEQLLLELLTTIEESPVELRVKPWMVLKAHAELLEKMSRTEESLTRHEEAIETARKKLGDDHAVVGELLLYMSRSIRWMEPARALVCAERGHAILLSALGPSHSSVQFGLRMMAAAQEALGRHPEAMASYERALAVGTEIRHSAPFAGAYALDGMADVAEAAGDLCLGLQYHEAEWEHLRSSAGPRHLETVHSACRLARACERLGQSERALKLMEKGLNDYTAIMGRTHTTTIATTLEVARMCWQYGKRPTSERLIAELEQLSSGTLSVAHRAELLLLKSIQAAEAGRADEQFRWLEEARRIYPVTDEGLQPVLGMIHVMLGGLLCLAGDQEASSRHHQAGVQQLFSEETMRACYARKLYATAQQGNEGEDGVAAQRLRELQVMSNVSIQAVSLAQVILPARPIRVAWNPKTPGHLAALNSNGQSFLFRWQESAGRLERLTDPFKPVGKVEDLSAVSLNWSESGVALRLHTPRGEQVQGRPEGEVCWVPASAVSPDGRHVLVMRRQSLRIARVQAVGTRLG